MYKIIFDCSLFCTHFEKRERKNERVDSSFFRSVDYLARLCLGRLYK